MGPGDDIVWVNGGVHAECGEYSDFLVLARASYVDMVGPMELTIVDKIYRDDNFFIYFHLFINQIDNYI